MIKRTLIAIAVVALLATSAHAALTEHYFPLAGGDHKMLKVDGSETIRWPYEYKALTVCTIPIKMHVGMYVQVKECKKKKVILQQVECGDIGEADDKYPCYLGCVKFSVRANFEVAMGTGLDKIGDTIADWKAWIKSGSPVPGNGQYHEVEACVKAWKTKIYNATPGDEVDVGTLSITVKPNV